MISYNENYNENKKFNSVLSSSVLSSLVKTVLMLSVLVINSDSDTIVSDNGTGCHLWPRTFFRP